MRDSSRVESREQGRLRATLFAFSACAPFTAGEGLFMVWVVNLCKRNKLPVCKSENLHMAVAGTSNWCTLLFHWIDFRSAKGVR